MSSPPVVDLPSTHASSRGGAAVLAIVVHATAGTDSRQWLVRNPRQVSAHVLIRKDGTIYRMVPDAQAAHHCGGSRIVVDGRAYTGSTRPNTNQITLGVELENLNDGRDPYPPAQLAALGWQLRSWRAAYQGAIIVRHAAIDLHGKADPAGLDQAAILRLLDVPGAEPARILGGPSVPATTLGAYLDARTPHLTWQQRQSLITSYCALGELTTIGNLRPFAQAVKEASAKNALGVYRPFLSRRFRENFNPVGLGATNDGAEGARFATIAQGVAAQYAHLLCYAATPGQLPADLATLQLLSPRREALAQTYGLGCAPTWEQLNGRWADPGPTYGQDILRLADAIAGERTEGVR